MAETSKWKHAGTSNSNYGSASTFEPFPPHFVQPVLAYNQSTLNIPREFYKRHVEGKITADEIELTSGASAVVWKVKLEGRQLTEGFGVFASSHAYRLGDFVIVRYDGGVRFHVRAFGPSCCEIQYSNADANVSAEDDEMSVEEEQSVTLAVTHDTIRSFRMYIPKDFSESSGLQRRRGEKISLINEAGAKWQVRLTIQISDRRRRMRLAGLREFLDANEIKAHDKLVFKLIWEDASTPALQMCEKIRAT